MTKADYISALELGDGHAHELGGLLKVVVGQVDSPASRAAFCAAALALKAHLTLQYSRYTAFGEILMGDLPLTVAIVTYNSEQYIRQCLETLLAFHGPKLPIVVIDNDSRDDTPGILRSFAGAIRVVYNRFNNGFAGGQNQAIQASDARWILSLNPDVRVTPGFIPGLIAAGEQDPKIGTVCGKLLALNPDLSVPVTPSFDSTGIYFTPELRHFDRGSKQADRGQFDRAEYVFGATGAAALYRREMINDISLKGEFFDEQFFAYREDADVAWRAQLLGWRCLYTPSAIAHHVRRVLPTNRRELPAAVNYHSVKNRFLMRVKNVDPALYRRHWLPILKRDLLVLGGCLFREPASLPAFLFVVRNWSRTWQKRQSIMRKRRTSPDELARWFAYHPVSQPAPPVQCASHF